MSWSVIEVLMMASGGSWWISFLLFLMIIEGSFWVFFHAVVKNETNELSDEDVDDLIEEHLLQSSPDDLVPSHLIGEKYLNPRVLQSKPLKYVQIKNMQCLNLATMNFLNLIGDEDIEESAMEAILRYGVGSCGPAGFYGTTDAHLNLEDHIAKFMGTAEAIVYSNGFACIASAIPAYAKRHDIIFADEQVNIAIQTGLHASRSTVKYFKHNSAKHLEKLLKEQAWLDEMHPEKAKKTRRFLVVEGIYLNTGSIVDLPRIMELKKKYKCRLFIDESISFGTIGNGRGVTRFFGIPVEDIDMIMGSLEYAAASIGGFCCGSMSVIQHQRLSGLGYCFSASQPPLLAVSAEEAINVMESRPEIFNNLVTACTSMHVALSKVTDVKLGGFELSPVKHLYLLPSYHEDRFCPLLALQLLERYCLNDRLAVTTSSYLDKEEQFVPVPSLRICVNQILTWVEIENVSRVIQVGLDTVKVILMSHSTDNPVDLGRQVDILHSLETEQPETEPDGQQASCSNLRHWVVGN